MAGTFSQIYIHIVFAVRGRENIISKTWREQLFKYIAGIIRNKNQKPVIVGGTSNHIHILIGIRPAMSISDIVRDIKNNSSSYVNDHGFLRGKFSWQEGYGAFSVSHADLDLVYRYILNQDIHHEKKKFKDEFCELLNTNDITFDDKYVFDDID